MKATKRPTFNPSIRPSNYPSKLTTSDPSQLPSIFPSVKSVKSITTALLATSGTCEVTEGLLQRLLSAVKKTFPAATKIEVIEFTAKCSSPVGRAASDTVVFVFEVTFDSTQPDTLLSPQEIIDTISQNSDSIAADLSDESGNEVFVIDVRLIENPSASPSLSPAPTHSLKPTLSISPSNKFFPSSSPTQSFVPTGTPTKAEDRTFKIVSSFQFDDSRRQWCLQAKNVRVNAKFNMRPCTDSRSKQKFYFDEYDQLRLRDHPIYCMRWKKKAIYLGYCPVGIETSKAKFIYEKDHQHFIVQKPRFQHLLGVSIHNKYEKVRMFKQGGNINDSTKSWSLYFVQQK
jgi:hypothetical protein|eukprot:scaffold8061_cov261-Chaetoceros_neogracile.AAC.2